MCHRNPTVVQLFVEMLFRGRSNHFFLPFSLFLTILSISVCYSLRFGDSKSTVRRIPFVHVRVKPDVGYLRGTHIDFDKEVGNFPFHSRAIRSVGDIKISDEFELEGDNHSVAFLHWAGKKSSVIYIYTCKTVKQTKGGHMSCEDAFFWRSVDYGSTFHRKDDSIGAKSISDVEFCPNNHKKVIISDGETKTLYISDNEGGNFSDVRVHNFSPHKISCNPGSQYQWLVAHDLSTHTLYYSSNGGTIWATLCDKVVRHYWAPKEFDSTGSTIFLEVQTGPYKSELRYAQLPFDFKKVKIFDKSLGNFSLYSLEVQGNYIFVQKDLPSKGLFVFYKNGNSKSNSNFFQRATFPLDKVEKEYTILDASENEVMVAVTHKDNSNLYVSDVTGLKFSLSLENILTSKAPIYGHNTTVVDIHRVKSLNGTYLANIHIHNPAGDSVKSVISYNKGGEWHLLRAPKYDHNGAPTYCEPPDCSLHVHMDLSQQYYYIPTVLSSPSAVGLIIAQGNLGKRLGQGIGVFLSRDGGLTWTKEFDKFYDFMIGDHGGILAAVPMRKDAGHVWYSCTEGKVWKNVTLGSKPVHVFAIVTEPGETTLVFNVFGHYARESFQWLSVKLNFSSVLNQKCIQKNYTYWSPNDERVDGECLLGRHIIYERRKAGDCCFNGKEYERKMNITDCICEADDFDCDFGYEHHALDEVCVATSSARPIPEDCPEGKTYRHTRGYRKVSGDRCKGGVEDQMMPETRPCPVRGPGGLSIKFTAVNKTVAIGQAVSFTLNQLKGSKESTWYLWDFGDGSVVNVTGLEKAKTQSHSFQHHGVFIVSVYAENTGGSSEFGVDITALDPIASVVIKPPHAVVIGEEAVFNITLYSNHTEEDFARHGYVHFMWIFDKSERPLLTWDHEVAHVFYRAKTYEVSVSAISVIGQKDAHTTITVYEVLTTVRLSFDKLLDDHYKDTEEWRSSFSQRLKASLYTLLHIESSRLEVALLYGLPTTADVSITPAPANSTSKSRKQIVDLLKDEVDAGNVDVQLPGHIAIRVTKIEVLPDRGYIDGSSPTPSHQDGAGRRTGLIIAIIAASLVAVILVVILAFFVKRYIRLRSSYSRLRLASERERMRDPLLQDQDDSEDEGLQPQPGGSFRYVPVAAYHEESESDDELLDNFNPGPLVVMPGSQNEEAAHELNVST